MRAGATRFEFAKADQQLAVFARALRALAKERPLVLWIDDVQWALEAVQLCAYLAKHDPEIPALVVLTARDDVLWSDPVIREMLAALRPERITVEALSADDGKALVSALLPLEPDLVERIAARTEGNPLFAVQLVGDWVARHWLLPGKDGFRLAPAIDPGLPDDLFRVWSDRIERFLSTREPNDGDALELAAAYGQEVALEPWLLVAGKNDCSPSAGLVAALSLERLAHERADGSWAFAHGMLREAVLRRAEEGERRRALHLAWAEWFRGRDDEALGRHLLEAGEFAGAVLPLLVAAERHLARGEARRALALLDLVETFPFASHAGARRTVTQSHPSRARTWMLGVRADGSRCSAGRRSGPNPCSSRCAPDRPAQKRLGRVETHATLPPPCCSTDRSSIAAGGAGALRRLAGIDYEHGRWAEAEPSSSRRSRCSARSAPRRGEPRALNRRRAFDRGSRSGHEPR
jgi:hypothetical protein